MHRPAHGRPDRPGARWRRPGRHRKGVGELRAGRRGSATRLAWLKRRHAAIMTEQFSFFDDSAPTRAYPDGFRYQADLLAVSDESALLEHIRQLPFREFEFHGYTGKRRVVSFGL